MNLENGFVTLKGSTNKRFTTNVDKSMYLKGKEKRSLSTLVWDNFMLLSSYNPYNSIGNVSAKWNQNIVCSFVKKGFLLPKLQTHQFTGYNM